MSAYIMNDDEINYIVSYFIDPSHFDKAPWLKIGDNYDYLNATNSAEVAKILQAENVRSVVGKYGDSIVDPWHAYEFEYIPAARKRPMGNIVGALDCLEYQSSESDDWHTTNAWDIICKLRKHMLTNAAEQDGTYTWGIE